jgi:hypothetical protein
MVEDPYPGPGHRCDYEHEWEIWAMKKYGDGAARGLKKRLVWQCPVCGTYYRTRTALLEHEHQWA